MYFLKQKIQTWATYIRQSAQPFNVNKSIIDLVYHHAFVGFIASIVCALIIFIRLYSLNHNYYLWSWYGIFISLITLRFAIVVCYYYKNNKYSNIKFWEHLFLLETFVGGLAWGLIFPIVYIHCDVYDQLIILMVVAGVTSGSVPFLAGILRASLLFLFATLLPLIYILLFLPSHQDYLIGFIILIFLMFLVVLSVQIHRMLNNTFLLQFELYEAKSLLELTNKKLEQSATHDPLTNAANRSLFNETFKTALDHAKQHKSILALFYLDLDQFKQINDLYGHHVGDRLLLIFVDRLESIFPESDSIFRLGGDEFTIIVENLSSMNEAAKIATRIFQAMVSPLSINKYKIDLKVSIGISFYPDDGEDVETLLNAADKAMYYAKKQGGNDFSINRHR